MWKRMKIFAMCTFATSLFISIAFYMNINKLKRSTGGFKVYNGSRFNLRHTTYKDINCSAIFANDKTEINKAIRLNSSNQEIISDQRYIELTMKCGEFRESRGYFDFSHVTQEEVDFPIAFSILLYKDVEQAERLLRAIYRPQNVYCIHVDADSKPSVHAAVDAIAKCFPNVFVASRKEYVVYAGFSRLQADLNCMEDLLKSEIRWKYFINLPSQQFPIKTNKELVRILKIYNGSNDIESTTGRIHANRKNRRHFYTYSKLENKPSLLRSKEVKREKPPFNITIKKGSAYGVFSQAMVRYIADSKVARAFLDYLRDVYSPDEYYWASLNHNPHIGAPGSYKGNSSKSYLASYSSWERTKDPCLGKFVRLVCIFGVRDLHRLVKLKHLFVNKFYYDFQPVALQCMEEWIYNRSLSDLEPSLNLTFYENLALVNNAPVKK